MHGHDNLREFRTRAPEIAAQYDSADPAFLLQFLKTAIDDIPAMAGKAALDLGAGAGHFAARLADGFNYTVTAVEPVAEMIAQGKLRHPAHKKIIWVQDGMPELSRLDHNDSGKYSLMTAFGSWHYMSAGDRQKSLQRLGDLAADESRLVIAYPYPPSREGQVSVPPEMFLDEVAASRVWRLVREGRLPYPVTENRAAQEKCPEILAFELVRA